MTLGGGGKEIYSTHDAAKICRVTPMTVIRWIRDGKIPAFKTAGGHRRILRADLERFCQSRNIPLRVLEAPERRILVIDPDAHTRQVIADAARSVDDQLTIETAGDALTGGCLLASFRPGLVFLDHRLPGIDPLEICTRLVRDPEMAPIAIVVTSDATAPDTERSFRARGALAVLAKPPVRLQVARAVRAAFRLPDTNHGGRAAPMIHIVDRDRRAGRTLRRELEGKVPNARVLQFDSPIDALFAVSLERPDLIVLDINAVEMQPDDMIRRVLGRMADHHVRIVALAPPNKEALRASILAAGACELLVKPCSAEELIDHLAPPPPPAKKRRRKR